MFETPTNQKDKKGRTTERHKKTLSLMADNVGLEHPLTKAQILEKAGYSPEICHNPKKVFGSVGFLQLVEEQLPTELILNKHRKGLDAMTVKFATCKGKITDMIEYPDYATRWKYIESVYKLKGIYTRNDNKPRDNDYSKLTPAEIREKVAQLFLKFGTLASSGSG